MSEDVKSIYGSDTPINNGRIVVLAGRLGGLTGIIQYKEDDRIAPGDINDYDKYDDKFLPPPTG